MKLDISQILASNSNLTGVLRFVLTPIGDAGDSFDAVQFDKFFDSFVIAKRRRWDCSFDFLRRCFLVRKILAMAIVLAFFWKEEKNVSKDFFLQCHFLAQMRFVLQRL